MSRLRNYEHGEPGFVEPFVRVDVMRDEAFDQLKLTDVPERHILWEEVKRRLMQDSRVQYNQHIVNGEAVDTWQRVR